MEVAAQDRSFFKKRPVHLYPPHICGLFNPIDDCDRFVAILPPLILILPGRKLLNDRAPLLARGSQELQRSVRDLWPRRILSSCEYLNARAQGGQETAQGREYQEEVGISRRLLEELQQRVLRFTISARGGYDDRLLLSFEGRRNCDLGHAPRILDREETIAQDDDIWMIAPGEGEVARDELERDRDAHLGSGSKCVGVVENSSVVKRLHLPIILRVRSFSSDRAKRPYLCICRGENG